jgi:general secretion pathway protein D
MSVFNRLTAVWVAAAMLAPLAPLQAKTKKGQKYLAEGRVYESKKQWDAALESYEKAQAEDPADISYQMALEKARFQAAQLHVDTAMKTRATGQLGEAMLEFQRAYAINPGSAVASQEIVRTQDMIERERKRVQQTGRESPASVRALTPAEEARKETRERINRMLPVPELKPLNPDAVKNLKINGQTVKVVFETIGKVAGINVLWDPEYQTPSRNTLNIDFADMGLEEALDNVATITKSFWKPLSPNTIFITNDNPNKRRDFADMVAKTFYLSNVNLPQELQEIVNAVRSVSELQRVVAYNSQNAIIVRGEADQVALAEKMIMDLDKPRAEVVVDIMVMEASSIFSRQLTAALAHTGLTVPLNFTPRQGLRVVTDAVTTPTTPTTPVTTPTTGDQTSIPVTTPVTTPTTTANSSGSTAIPLSNLGRLASSDFSISLPSALLQAAMSDTNTKVLQAPQLRSMDNVKATMKIGEREPTASGSFQPGIGGVGINPLVNTQFNFIDVGVNVELTPRVHDNGDVSMHVDLDISSVTGHVNLGGIDQPIIGQRKISHDIRMREGEVGLLGGLINQQENKQITGIPGLSSIPLLRRLFTGESIDRSRSELMVILIPHIIRRQELFTENLRGIAVGGASVKISRAPKPPENPPALPGARAAVPEGALPPTNPLATAPPATAPPATAPPATAPPETAPPATAPPATTAPAGATRVAFTPLQAEANQGGTVMVTLSVEGATDLASAPMQIQFDPKVLTLTDAVPAGFLSNDGRQPVFTKNIMNESGTASIQLGRQPGSPGVNGAGPLLTLTFQAVGKGTSTITIPNLTLRNSQGAALTSASPQVGVTIK